MTRLLLTSAVAVLASVLPAFAEKPTFEQLSEMVRKRSPNLQKALVEAMGEENIRKGVAWYDHGPDFIWAVEAASEPALWINEAPAPGKMTRVKGTNLWYGTSRLRTSRTHNFHYVVAGETFGGRNDVPAFGPYSYPKPGVPRGKLSEKMVHASKSAYPGMRSDYWVYTPAQYDPNKPAALMVWQDGEVLVPRELPSRAQIVFDNLTHEGKIPVIVHVLISPGFIGERRMRSVEYDTVDDTYPRFLRDEILAEVSAKYNIRKDAYSRAIAGDSSGGICAFNAAWQHPDQFSRVLSRIGSFTSIQWKPNQLDGGQSYPNKVRKEEKRNIRVWLQDGWGDLENAHGSWPLQNIQMANSLKLKEYDFFFSWGNGTHSRNGGHAELAEEMIWLWRDYDPAKTQQLYEMDPAEKSKPLYRIMRLNRE
ncbi:MAG: alpha/beta hydrolase [Bryobacteraceae bacterium]